MNSKKTQKAHKGKLLYLDPYNKEALKFIKRNYKYIHSSHQFNHERDCPDILVSRFLKRIKDSKVVYNFKLSWAHEKNGRLKEEILASIYKKHGKSLKSAKLIIPDISQHALFPTAFKQLKSVQEISLADRFLDLEAVPVLPRSQKLTFHVVDDAGSLFKLSKILHEKIESLRIVISSGLLGKSREKIKEALSLIKEKFKSLELLVFVDTEEVENLEEILKDHQCGHLSFLKNFSNGLGNKIFQESALQNLKNLQTLTLQFEENLRDQVTFMKNFDQLEKLEFLDITFPMNDDKALCQSIFGNFKLPSSLIGLKLKIRTNLSCLVVKNKETLILFERDNKIDDSVNFFEDEPLCIPFFQAFEQAKGLKHLDLDLSFSELFVSPFTNFISSIFKRIQNAESIKFWAYEKDITVNPDSKAEENGENCINLPLLFDCCPNLQNLKILDFSMPNYHFGYTNLLQKFPKLHTFILGTQETLFFEKISQQIDRLLKSLIINDIRVLDMEFTETLTLGSLVKRFSSFKKFHNLQFLSARYKVTKIDYDGIKNLGNAIQGLKNLQFLYLAIENFEKDLSGLAPYIKYHPSLKDSHLCFIE